MLVTTNIYLKEEENAFFFFLLCTSFEIYGHYITICTIFQIEHTVKKNKNRTYILHHLGHKET